MGTSRAWRKVVSLALVLAYASAVLSGCLSVKARPGRPSEGPGGGVAVQVFKDDGAKRAGKPGPAGLVGELQRRDAGHWRTIFRSINPTWAVAGLPAGEYRLVFPARLDDAGNVVRLEGKDKTLKVEEGRVTEVHVVLESVNKGLVVVGVVAAVAAAVVLAAFLSDFDLPDLPVPPPELVEVAFHVSLDLFASGPWVSVSDSMPPVVTSHFPADGAIVAAARPRIVLSISEPLQATSLTSSAVTVLAEGGGIIPGTVSYDSEHWFVTWAPQADLPHGDSIHVTLDPSQVEDLSGNEPGSPSSFSFKTAR